MIDKVIVIGLCGYKNSGKDTVASMLLNQISVHDFTATRRIGFADQVKEELAALFDTNIEWINKAKNEQPAMRRILQWYGTDYKRRELGNENVWIEATAKQVAKAPPSTFIVIPDMRFPNEADYIRTLPYNAIVKVERAGQCNDDLHESEQYVAKIRPDFYLANNGKTLPALEWEVKILKRQLWDKLKL